VFIADEVLLACLITTSHKNSHAVPIQQAIPILGEHREVTTPARPGFGTQRCSDLDFDPFAAF